MSKPRYVKIDNNSSDVEFFICELAEKLFKLTTKVGAMLETEKGFSGGEIAMVFYNGIINFACQGVHILGTEVPPEKKQEFLKNFTVNLANAIDTYEEMHKDCNHCANH